MTYVNIKQEERFIELLKRARANNEDKERKAFFYVIAGNNDLYKQVNKIYDFEQQQLRCIDFNGEITLEGLFLSSSSKALLNLALELYNQSTHISVDDVFKSLDSNNSKLAINAIKIRFSIC